MELVKKINGSCLRIWLGGRFLIGDYEQFYELIDLIKSNNEIAETEIYLDGLSFLDSSALGMLLQVRDASVEKSKNIRLYHPCGQVRNQFEISRFYDLFDIVDKPDLENGPSLTSD